MVRSGPRIFEQMRLDWKEWIEAELEVVERVERCESSCLESRAVPEEKFPFEACGEGP
jgi:hypothetical protein